MNRLWLVAHLDPRKRGSMEQQLLALAQALRGHGIAPTYVFAGPGKPSVMDDLRAAGAELRRLDFSDALRSSRTLFAWLREAQPAVVHTHFVRAYSPIVWAAAASRGKVAVHEHVTLLDPPGPKQKVKRVRSALLNPLAALRVCVSQPVAESVIRADAEDPARVCVVENGIDVSRFANATSDGVRAELGIAADAQVMTCVARLDDEKGVETAVRAVPLLGPKGHLVLVGEGPREAAWRRLAAELGVAKRVHFLGLRSDVERVLAASDAVVVPSHWEEAFGLAVVEGMAAGKPVIVSRSGAMPGIVGDAGIVVEKRDPAGLAAVARRVLENRDVGAALGAKGRARAQERYSLSTWVDRTLEVYDRLALFGGERRAA